MDNYDDGVCGGSGAGCSRGLGGADPFIDRSKVRILLCDSDSKSSEEICELLCKCSYQVTSVKSARQVIDALNAEGPDIDIILCEVDLPVKKGMKMLKYITHDRGLQRIPIIMMSPQDEVTLVVRCLRLGAADYLVKPLRTNELLNLWTHMWRRRRMQLGLSEKNIFSYELDIVASDLSDTNTNSTTLFSDDTDDRSRRIVNPEVTFANHREDELSLHGGLNANIPIMRLSASILAPPVHILVDSTECRPGVPGISDCRTAESPTVEEKKTMGLGNKIAGHLSSFPKKSELKIGESSAFFTYVKSSMLRNNTQGAETRDGIAAQSLREREKSKTWNQQAENNTPSHENVEAMEINSQGDDFPSSMSVPDSTLMERSCTPPVSLEIVHGKCNDKGTSEVHMHPRNGAQPDVSGFLPHGAYPYFMPGLMNQVLMPSHIYQKNLTGIHNNENSAMVPQYNHLPQCAPGMASYPYYPVNICLSQGQASTNHRWPSVGNSSVCETKVSKDERREAALIKFRQKRKERCFDKKIRYANRKKLAERRPRVRGQFVRKMNGVTVDLNGEPSSADMEDYEEDDMASRESSPEDDAL